MLAYTHHRLPLKTENPAARACVCCVMCVREVSEVVGRVVSSRARSVDPSHQPLHDTARLRLRELCSALPSWHHLCPVSILTSPSCSLSELCIY